MSFARRLLPLMVLALVGCPGPQSGVSATSTSLQLQLERLSPIRREQGHYAVWAIAGATTSVGTPFLVTGEGLRTLEGAAWDGKATVPFARGDLSQVLVTLEPPTSADRLPAKQEILRGGVANGKAVLVLAAPFEPGALETATGSYLLDNPSTISLGDMNGVCFMNERRSAGGLQVPFPPPEKWGYESWIELKGRLMPLGKFVDPDGPDDWNGFSGRVPPFPGEDFNENLPEGVETGFNRPDLRGAKLIVSVEPRSLQREEVFPSIRVFEATVPMDAEHYKAYRMQNVAADGLPRGAATILD